MLVQNRANRSTDQEWDILGNKSGVKMEKIDVLAFDLGASSGRAIIGRFNGETVETTEVHRFENGFEKIGGVDSWNFANLLQNVKIGFVKAKESGFSPQSFGIDTWGVDYGLLDKNGDLLADPRAYRGATDEAMLDAFAKIGKKEIFRRTGIAALNFNTIYQLNQRVLEKDPDLQKADHLLMIPDLLGYFLTGSDYSEYTNVTTTNLFNITKQDWDFELAELLQIPTGIFGKIDYSGHVRSKIKTEIAAELGIDPIPLIAVGTHDTASAVAAIPLRKNYAFCSSGTWSLCGIEADRAVISDLVYDSNFSNEGTIQGGVRPLKNIMGMWIINECRREWGGNSVAWSVIDRAAAEAKPFKAVLNPNYSEFFSSGNMIQKIQDFCRNSGQEVPSTMGEIARTIYESLALSYRHVMKTMSSVQGSPIEGLNITGGGIQNLMLNQMTADCAGLPVITGPVEGAALGNMMAQLIGLKAVQNITAARKIVSASVKMTDYQPRPAEKAGWDRQYEKFCDLL